MTSAEPPTRVFRAPGRVNLIGEHTDYNLGLVLPMALDLACSAITNRPSDGRVRVASEKLPQRREWHVAETAHLVKRGDWTDYVAGVARELVRAGGKIEPADIRIRSTVPMGSGLSSSAALEVASALALLGDQQIEPLELARLCQRAEVDFVGMPCGIMDQYVALLGREGAAIKIDCRTLEHQVIPLPDVAIVVVNSMVKHELGLSAYKQRTEECALVVEAMRQHEPWIRSLRDIDLAMLEALRATIAPVCWRRARHVITENARVEQFAAAAESADPVKMGDLFIASHRSLQCDYEVSCEELDFLVDTALTLPGVYGARMTGGGFGGCTVNLLAPEAASGFEAAITRTHIERNLMLPRRSIRASPRPGLRFRAGRKSLGFG